MCLLSYKNIGKKVKLKPIFLESQGYLFWAFEIKSISIWLLDYIHFYIEYISKGPEIIYVPLEKSI